VDSNLLANQDGGFRINIILLCKFSELVHS
jgi:hypothetical protein